MLDQFKAWLAKDGHGAALLGAAVVILFQEWVEVTHRRLCELEATRGMVPIDDVATLYDLGNLEASLKDQFVTKGEQSK